MKRLTLCGLDIVQGLYMARTVYECTLKKYYVNKLTYIKETDSLRSTALSDAHSANVARTVYTCTYMKNDLYI